MAVYYADVVKSINTTQFEVYVRNSYTPVIHPFYIDHPDVPMIGHENPNMEITDDDMCFSKLPVNYIVDMLVNGEPFSFVHTKDVAKMEAIIKSYVAQCDEAKDQLKPEMKPLVEKYRKAYGMLHEHTLDRERRQSAHQPKKLSIADILRALGPHAL